MELSLSANKILNLLGILLASFAFVNALIFFSALFIPSPDVSALCGGDCNAQEQEALTSAWSSYRTHGVIAQLCIAILFAAIGIMFKKTLS